MAAVGARLVEVGGGVGREEGEESGENGRSGKRALDRVVVENSGMVVDASAAELAGEAEESVVVRVEEVEEEVEVEVEVRSGGEEEE